MGKMSIEAITSGKNPLNVMAAAKVSNLWLMTVGLYAFITAWFFLSERLSVNLVSFGKIWAVAGALLVWEASARLRRTGTLASDNPSGRVIFAHVVLTIPALGILNHLLMSLNFPLADNLLAGWDERLGFNWLAYANTIGDSYFLSHFTNYTYSLLIIVILIIALEKILSRDYARCQELFTLYLYSALTAIVIASFFPSRGSMDRYADAATRLKFDAGTGTAFIRQLMELRSTDPLTVDPLQLLGLAEFPSFHTAAAILIAYACRGNSIRLAFGSVFAVGMIAGTPIYGGHYFVDLIAGAGIAISAIAISQYRKRNTRHANPA